MAKQHHIIYFPGLGTPDLQEDLFKKWRKAGIIPHFVQIRWTVDEPLATKLKRATDLIDTIYNSGDTVSLVGVSAGAGAALNAYMPRKNKISGVVYVCGKLLGGPQSVGPHYFKKNPSFRASLELTQKNLEKLTDTDKAKMLSLHPLFDEIVYVKHTKIPGVKSITLPSILHVPTIFLCLTIYKRFAINFLKKRPSVK